MKGDGRSLTPASFHSCQLVRKDFLDEVLETRRRTGTDDFALVAADVAEAMRQGSLEIIGITGPEYPRLAADGEFDSSLDDHPALLAGVSQHLLARIGIWRIALVQNRHGAFCETAADQAQLDARGAYIAEFLPWEEHLGLPTEIQGEEIGKRHGNAVEHLLQRADRGTHPVLLDQGNQSVRHPGALRQLTLRQPVHLPHGFQMGTHV